MVNTNEMLIQHLKDPIKKWIIFLLSIDNTSIRGKTKLTKAMFIWSKSTPVLDSIIEFFPHQFGPYSNKLGEAINELINAEIIDTIQVKNDWEFGIIDKYNNFIKNQLNKENEVIILNLKELKDYINSKPLRSILRKLYEDYPEYAVNSRVKGDLLIG